MKTQKRLLITFVALLASSGCVSAVKKPDPIVSIEVTQRYVLCKERKLCTKYDESRNEFIDCYPDFVGDYLCTPPNPYIVMEREDALKAAVRERDAIIECYEAQAKTGVIK